MCLCSHTYTDLNLSSCVWPVLLEMNKSAPGQKKKLNSHDATDVSPAMQEKVICSFSAPTHPQQHILHFPVCASVHSNWGTCESAGPITKH